MKPPRTSDYYAEVESNVAGIPCRIGVLDWEPFVPGRLQGLPENCYPDEGGCGEWVVLDRRGRPAEWLERKLTSADSARIDAELLDYFEKNSAEE